MTVSFTLLTLITIVAAALAIYDGIARLRGKRSNSILAIAELVFSVLMVLSVFIAFPSPFSTLLFAIILEGVLLLVLLFRGTGRRGATMITTIAIILIAIVILIAAGWLRIPGIS